MALARPDPTGTIYCRLGAPIPSLRADIRYRHGRCRHRLPVLSDPFGWVGWPTRAGRWKAGVPGQGGPYDPIVEHTNRRVVAWHDTTRVAAVCNREAGNGAADGGAAGNTEVDNGEAPTTPDNGGGGNGPSHGL